MITALVLLGQVLELRARAQTSGAIKSLLGCRRRRPGSSRTTASRPIFLWSTCTWGTRCAFVPERRFPSTEPVLEGEQCRR